MLYCDQRPSSSNCLLFMLFSLFIGSQRTKKDPAPVYFLTPYQQTERGFQQKSQTMLQLSSSLVATDVA